ncbi:class GN sortase [Shewanella sp. AS16]|uniref:class GN sortase n=1 Tax=Shewanella sp. AS16 TaxID=2907625 RepID=UPI001F2BC7EC|nr:class GN sortase [Shewanella sp. AS16]MCE9687517.1 class GN sortase [Shewanella sp. AS16]
MALSRAMRRYGWLPVLLLGVILFGRGVYMQAKAHFAQFLIQAAWQQTLRDQRPHKPWHWADTYPVAKLSVPLMSAGTDAVIRVKDMYVLAGASGRNLAFGPALVLSGARVGEAGNSVIAGHRDTHFGILQEVRQGQPLWLQTADGRELAYRVVSIRVVHESDSRFMARDGEDRLTLITCYPFDALTAGAELRFIVEAVPRMSELREP